MKLQLDYRFNMIKIETLKNSPLYEVFSVFFRLGCFAFGGPAAHIAMMEREIIEERKWMSSQEFLDLVGVTNLIPGPNSTEMTMHCGYKRAGFLGLITAGFAFIIPSVILTGILAFLYVRYGELPQVAPFILGIKPIILSVIAGAVLKLSKKALKDWLLYLIALIAFVLCLAGISEFKVLFTVGITSGLALYLKDNGFKNLNNASPLLLTVPLNSISSISLSGIFFTFLKVGAILYGSGYVLFAFLDTELVKEGLLSRPELLDAIAVGQFTPGPVLSTSTFIGYQLGFKTDAQVSSGIYGALLATAGIFLPSFIFAGLLHFIMNKLKSSKLLRQILNSVNAVAVAIMASVLVIMAKDVILSGVEINWKNFVIVLLGIVLTFYFKKLSTIWVVIIGSVSGFLLTLV